jgi:uncharacterized membrane protein YeaQ/YmgE (transglycosylase-associated protein family)
VYLILAFIVIGMVAGWLAHYVVEPHRAVNWPVSFAAGLVGSFAGAILVLLVRRLFLAGKAPAGKSRSASSKKANSASRRRR